MAFDYGGKRTGIAVSDPLQIVATGLTTVSSETIFDFLKTYLRNETVECFVVGEPKNLDNSPSEIAGEVNAFVDLLQKSYPDIPVRRIDERFSSKMAAQTLFASGLKKKQRQNKSLLDEVSATIILQGFMEMKHLKI